VQSATKYRRGGRVSAFILGTPMKNAPAASVCRRTALAPRRCSKQQSRNCDMLLQSNGSACRTDGTILAEVVTGGVMGGMQSPG
jgi:hypothetical protein